MFRFFRQLRQRLLTDNKFSKYFLYAVGEILLVVIGIIIALQINNWDESQKREEQKRSLLLNVRNELVANIEESERLLMELKTQDSLYAILNADQFDWDTQDFQTVWGFLLIPTNKYTSRFAKAAYVNYMNFMFQIDESRGNLDLTLSQIYQQNTPFLESDNGASLLDRSYKDNTLRLLPNLTPLKPEESDNKKRYLAYKKHILKNPQYAFFIREHYNEILRPKIKEIYLFIRLAHEALQELNSNYGPFEEDIPIGQADKQEKLIGKYVYSNQPNSNLWRGGIIDSLVIYEENGRLYESCTSHPESVFEIWQINSETIISGVDFPTFWDVAYHGPDSVRLRQYGDELFKVAD